MTDPQDLLRLADEVAAATEYDGNLMARIDCAVRFPHLRPAQPDDHPSVKDRRYNPADIWTPTGWLMARNYWRSVDDSRSLLTDNAYWRLGNDGEGPDVSAFKATVTSGDGPTLAFHDAVAATPALALCCAALRARAHSTKDTSNVG